MMADLIEANLVDRQRHRIFIDGEWKSLAGHEWRLFELLFNNLGHVVPIRKIYEHVWPAQSPESESSLRNLRWLMTRRLKNSDFMVLSHRGIGMEMVLAT